MTTVGHTRREKALAVGFAFVAGFADSLGFMFLGGMFLSFMSGNVTRMAVSSIEGHPETAVLAASCVGAFLFGVVEGAFVRRLAMRTARRDWVREIVMANMCILFVISSLLLAAGLPRVAMVTLGAGIGSMNSIFERGGEVSIPLTYMTGTLVKMGQHLADVFFGGTHGAWLQHFVMIVGLTAGAFLGGFSYLYFELGSLYIATLLVLALTVFTYIWRARARHGRRGPTIRRIHTQPA